MTRRESAVRTQRTALAGLIVNVALALIKLVAGVLGNSYALVADAIESMTDIVGSAIIWGGLRIGARGPDTTHPYGHGKAEALAALVVAFLIIAAGLGIGVTAVREILTPHGSPAPFTLGVLVAVVIAKEVLYRYTRGVAAEESSGATRMDAWHHRADAITSAAAFVGISVAVLGPALLGGSRERWAPADDWAALLAGGVIALNGLLVIRTPLHELMDADPVAYDPDILDRAARAALGVAGVRAIEKRRARKHGNRYWLDMHVEVDPRMSVADAHVLTGKIKSAVREELPAVADVLIHVEPHGPGPAAA